MKLITTLTASIVLLASPAFAQDHQDHQDHGDHGEKHEHETHDHGDGHHEDMASDEMASSEIEAAEGRTVTVKVNGMVCDFCARSLTKVLKKKDAVEDVAISLEDKTVTILLKEGSAMSDEEIEKAVKNAGYNLAAIERA